MKSKGGLVTPEDYAVWIGEILDEAMAGRVKLRVVQLWPGFEWP